MIGNGIATAATALFTDNLPPADLKSLVPKITVPVFFVYGEKGQPTEKPANEGFYEAARGQKEIWEVPGSGHMKGIEAQPEEYERRVVGFFDRALLGRRHRKEHPMTSALRQLFIVATSLTLAVALWWHPPGGEDIFADVSGDVGAWLFVHTTLLLITPLLGIAAYMLLRGLESRAATVSRIALVFFLVFYTAYEVTVGLGTGVLVDYANDLSPAEQAAVAGAIQDYNGNAILADPSIALVLGFFGWVVAMLAAALAFRQAGAGWPVTLLVGCSALFALHPPPIGPVGLVCFAAAGVLIEAGKGREVRAPVIPATPRPA